MTLIDCTVDRGCTLTGTWLTDVEARNLRCTGDVQFLNGCVFERVTLAGRVDRMVLSSFPVVVSEETRAAFAAEAEMDWALDISAADSLELNVRDVPVDLVRRDPTVQAVVRGANLVGKDWEAVDFEETWFRAALRSIVRGDETDAVLVTPTRKRNADAFVRVIGRLRDAGIADPD